MLSRHSHFMFTISRFTIWFIVEVQSILNYDLTFKLEYNVASSTLELMTSHASSSHTRSSGMQACLLCVDTSKLRSFPWRKTKISRSSSCNAWRPGITKMHSAHVLSISMMEPFSIQPKKVWSSYSCLQTRKSTTGALFHPSAHRAPFLRNIVLFALHDAHGLDIRLSKIDDVEPLLFNAYSNR